MKNASDPQMPQARIRTSRSCEPTCGWAASMISVVPGPVTVVTNIYSSLCLKALGCSLFEETRPVGKHSAVYDLDANTRGICEVGEHRQRLAARAGL